MDCCGEQSVLFTAGTPREGLVPIRFPKSIAALALQHQQSLEDIDHVAESSVAHFIIIIIVVPSLPIAGATPRLGLLGSPRAF